MVSKRARWNRLGRFMSGAIVACFFLPFFGVSCQGMDVVTVSGADMVGGCKPGGLISEAADEASAHPDRVKGGSIEGHLDNVPREPLAIVALALVVIGFGLAWARTRPALVGSFGLAVVSLGVVIALWAKVSGDLHEMVDGQLSQKKDPMHIVEDGDVSSGSRFGLWLVVAGLVGIAALTGLALREQDPPAPVA